MRERLSGVAHLAASRSASADIARLAAEAALSLACIERDVDGFTIPRDDRLDEFVERLASKRFLQILGQPGVGKSALLRAAAERSAGTGPILVLKADRLAPGGWPAYAQRLHLDQGQPRDLLRELSAIGEPVLFIDGLDRVRREDRALLMDILTPILEDPLLSGWRIVASARDGATEHLRQWLPRDLVGPDGFETLRVEPLDDAEAQLLLRAKPHLQPLLYGPDAVQEVARRPFFLAILARLMRGLEAEAPPASETELLSAWWRGGGYDAEGGLRARRQETLIALAERGAVSLSRDVAVRGLDHDALEDLRNDGVLKESEPGHTVSFQHDIFFEWAFTHGLIDAGVAWRDRLAAAGEPPALGRPVELLSQLRFERGDEWIGELERIEAGSSRTQWLRSWLLGPLSSARFDVLSARFSRAVRGNANDRLERLMTWFQAVRTDANRRLLSSASLSHLEPLERMRLADTLGVPADPMAWRRLIFWLLDEPDAMPPELWPSALTLFEVWQNAFGGFDNPISRAVLGQSQRWLIAVEDAGHPEEWRPRDGLEGLDRDELETLEPRLRGLMLRGAQVYPDLAATYLERLQTRPAVNHRVWGELAYVADALATVAPGDLVDALLAGALDPLPKAKVERARLDYDRRIKASEEAKNEMEAELLRPVIFHPGVDRWDWDRLSLDRMGQAFYPPTPDSQPFKALLEHAPAEGLRLVKAVANHAVEAWRELNEVDYERRATPIPLRIAFPWGEETYWGTWREYVAFRACFAPSILEAGLMALEDWAFGQVEAGRPLDEVIEQVARDTQHPAILGVCVALFVGHPVSTETTLVLATAQRLWDWDLTRFVKMDQGPCANLIAAGGNPTHMAALRRANDRPARKVLLRDQALRFLLQPDFRDAFSAAVKAFATDPPFEFEEEKSDPEAVDRMTSAARHRAALGEVHNYAARTVDGGLEIQFVNPHADEPEVRQASEDYFTLNRWLRVANWLRARIDRDGDAADWPLDELVAEAQSFDTDDLFTRPTTTGDLFEILRTDVAGVATVVLTEAGVGSEHFAWAQSVIFRAMSTPEPQDGLTAPESSVMFHPLCYASVGLAALVRARSSSDDARACLLRLLYHPLHEVSVRAARAIYGLADVDPRLVLVSLSLILTLSIRRDTRRAYFKDRAGTHATLWGARTAAVNAALAALFENGQSELPKIPMPIEPPPPERKRGFNFNDEFDDEQDTWLDVAFLGKHLAVLPPEALRTAGCIRELRQLSEDLLRWTVAKDRPDPFGRRRSQTSALWEWRMALMSWLVGASSDLEADEVIRSILDPICELPDEPAFALLRDYANALICRDVYDSQAVAGRTLRLVERLTQRITAMRGSRRGDTPDDGLHLIKLVFGTAVSKADAAKRFANGDFRDLPIVLPFVDVILVALHTHTAVARTWLTLVERSIDHYPSQIFGRQAQMLLAAADRRRALRAADAPARLSNIIQVFADREALDEQARDVFLRLLDALIDDGDRRASALQRGELFRRTPRLAEPL